MQIPRGAMKCLQEGIISKIDKINHFIERGYSISLVDGMYSEVMEAMGFLEKHCIITSDLAKELHDLELNIQSYKESFDVEQVIK